MADLLLDSLLSAAKEDAPKASFDDALTGLDVSDPAPKPKHRLQLKDKAATDSAEAIHTGLTDSSDDEDNRDFENRKYNESGKSIKHLLECFEAPQPTRLTNHHQKQSTWKTTNRSLGAVEKPRAPPNSDAAFGIRIINPLVSSQVLEERMVGRQVIPLARIKMFVRNVPEGTDWVVAGVLVHKGATRTSQNGKNFCIWTLSDLKTDLKTISVFLFGTSYRELWKTVVGTVVGILNPSVMERREGSKDEACLSVDNFQRVMILGQSKDLGTCKSTKRSGERCTAFVNVGNCEFCIYHVKQEYQKCSKRSELQSSFAGGGLTALRNKVLGKNQVFYGGKIFAAIKSKKQTAKDEGRLRALSGLGGPSAGPPVKKTKKQQAAVSLELAAKQKQRDLERLRLLGVKSAGPQVDGQVQKFTAGLSRDVSASDSKNLALDVINKLKNQKNNPKDIQEALHPPQLTQLNNKPDESSLVDLNLDFRNLKQGQPQKQKENSTTQATNKCSPLMGSFKNVPLLSGKGKSRIDLSAPIKRKQSVRAKQNALTWIQNNGPLMKQDPNNTRGTDQGKKRALEALNEMVVEPQLKRAKPDPHIEENEFYSERFKKMMAATSKHRDLLDERDNEEQEKHFQKLEMRERMEEKMQTTYKVACKAVRCLRCKYTSFSASDLCKAEKHPLKVFDAMKRFFKCGNCGNRTVCLELVPMGACKNCGSGKWERTGMMSERKVDIGAPKLSIRGGEQTFVNSVITDVNLDLLMPDE